MLKTKVTNSCSLKDDFHHAKICQILIANCDLQNVQIYITHTERYITKNVEKMKYRIRIFSSIDTINQIAVNVPHQPIRPLSGQRKVYVTGWAFDGVLNNLVDEVFVCIGKCEFKAVYRLDRADVAKHYRNPLILQCGFFCNIPVDAFLAGENIVSIKVVVSNENEAFYNINPIEIDVQK